MCDSGGAMYSESTTYFVMKCTSLCSLQQCVQSNQWACRKREKPPHPIDLLSSAHRNGRVVLIFSVNGQHGWHGFCDSCHATEYADRVSEVSCNSSDSFSGCDIVTESTDNTNSSSNYPEDNTKPWHHFQVKWLVHFQEFNPQSCLDFNRTEHLILSDGSPLNKARNWQQIPEDVGQQLCSLLEEYRTQLVSNREEQQIRPTETESFFKNIISDLNGKNTWDSVMTKVRKELGEVHLACPFGSQRYNCETAESDLDIFIVYQAKTLDVLSLDPPKQTIKNSHHEDVDYSVLEIHRYCELLVKGDTKCVETLFLFDSPVVMFASNAWHKLCEHRHKLLTQHCFDKYMKEIHGTTGLKQFQRWKESNPSTDKLTQKLNKLGYIILRLLQNARDMVKNRELVVFRAEMSVERCELLSMREGAYTYTQFMDIVDRYLAEISHHNIHGVDNVPAKTAVQDWLLECRLQDIQLQPQGGSF